MMVGSWPRRPSSSWSRTSDSERESIGSGSTRRRTRSMSSDDPGLDAPRVPPERSPEREIDKAEDTPRDRYSGPLGPKMARISFRALAIETLTHLDVSDNSITRLVPDIGGLSFPRKAGCVGQPTTISTERIRRVRRVNMVRLCSQQNRLVPGQCLSVRTAPVLGPVTKSIPRITSPGRRPGTPPAN